MKKFMSITVASAMVMTLLAGCGGAASTDSAPADTTEATEVAESTETAENTGVAEGGNGVFKIGGIGPITGGAAVYGMAVQNAAFLAVDEINAAGGIGGYQIEFKFEDDENDPEKSVNAYNTLKDWDMQLLMGTVTSGCSVAVAEKTAADNMFQLTPSGSSVDCIKYDNAFRVCFSDPDQGMASAKYIGDNAVASKVAVIYDSSDIYSSGIYQKFVSESASQPFEVVSAEAFTADSKTDFSVQLQKAKDSGADLVFLPIYYTEAALILSQAAAMNYDPIFFGCDGLDGILDVENFDTALAEGVMLLTPFAADAEDELTQNFVSAYKERFGETPNQFAADSYDAIYAIKAALENASVTPDMDVSAICDAMKVSMTEITIDGLTGIGMSWEASGEPNKEPKAVQITNGVYTAM
ncbi:ABC transporter substrate-binding protein [Kineothrix sp. MB12-C1]|uniref:ABC transporter substrate-binding protein n=1 Tax=Kineothrix sp. MB12-C1 TaxID=3070215 RepID=UPI0027D2A107|nr:ABC transporter substrate-binding protein [Kineothrix sp. MB12-C1]WMC92797.1 ABC transporter substrate-binding protein [Kineothrix sp. MB12-C1]